MLSEGETLNSRSEQMATRSTIAVVHKDGTVSQVYCHFDGDLSHNGELLIENYNTLDLAEELVSGGPMSTLGDSITSVVYYGRDCGDNRCYPSKSWNVDIYKLPGFWQDYNYLFIDGQWMYRRYELETFHSVKVGLSNMANQLA
jgi:hypothetical protein